MENKVYRFQLFGGLILRVEDRTYVLSDILEQQLCALLAFFVCNHKQSVSKGKIIDSFWQESENPANALKYAVHRLRAGLKKIGGDLDENVIITTASGYQLNPEMEVELDTEEFEKLVLKGKSEKKLLLLEQACDMYHGDFMEGSKEEWVLVDRGYYTSIFTQLCHTMAEHFMKKEQNKKAIEYCERGLRTDEFSEALIYTYLKVLILEKRYSYAQSFYDTINAKYKKRLGFSLDTLNKEYSFKHLLSQHIVEDESEDTEKITLTLGEEAVVGPMVVNENVFNVLCEYEMRNISRNPMPEYVICMILETKKQYEDSIMHLLMNILEMSFRKNDVITKLSDNKVALLVRLAHESDVEILYNRVNARLSEQIEEYSYHLTYVIRLIANSYHR